MSKERHNKDWREVTPEFLQAFQEVMALSDEERLEAQESVDRYAHIVFRIFLRHLAEHGCEKTEEEILQEFARGLRILKQPPEKSESPRPCTQLSLF